MAKTPPRKPPVNVAKSIQYDLFTQFVTNDQSEVSNTVELWESIPKYFLTPKQVEKLRQGNGNLAEPCEWNYSYNDMPCTVVIQPALIKQKDGSYKAFFPGITEEFVEEALKKTFTDQHHGLHDAANLESWVRFSLSLLYKELKAQGRKRDRNQIKHAIDVMSKCVLTFYLDGKSIWTGSILQDLTTIERGDYLADTEAHHIARLPLFISKAVNQLDYRQFNYQRLMQCDEQLSRWIYKQLINRFTQASTITSYHFTYSGLASDSALLQQNSARDNRKKVISALNELIEQGVISRYDVEPRKSGRTIVDVKYTLHPSPSFIKEQKAANKRARDAQRLLDDSVDGSVRNSVSIL